MPGMPETRRLRLAASAGLLLLCLAAHLSADLAWLYQHGAAEGPAALSSRVGTRAPAAADPHGEGALPAAAPAAAYLALFVLLAALPPFVTASPRPRLLHPPAS